MRALLLAAVLLGACGGGETLTRTGKLRVVATTGMVADLARVVGGSDVEVTALMGAGVDPHLFKASAGDVARLEQADVILYSGLGLEGKMGDILVKMASTRPVQAVCEAVPEAERLEPAELEGHYDPHVWFDVALWAKTTQSVASALAAADPDRREAYAGRAAEYRATLGGLHAEVMAALAQIPRERRVLITSHDAFRYLGRAYDLDVRGVQGISTVSDAGVKDIEEVADLIVERGIKAIFVESSVSPRTIEAVVAAARAKGQEVRIGGELYSDAMGDAPPEDTYVGMVRANVRKLVEALR